jgi:putative ABC transport system substrate-binding protein
MKRRRFIAAAAAALLVSPTRSWAQGTPRRVGILDPVPKDQPAWKVWQDGLRDHGWIEGKNLIIDYRSSEGHAERVPLWRPSLSPSSPIYSLASARRQP